MYQVFRLILFTCVMVGHSPQRRHALRWISSMRPGYLLRKPSPWLTFDAIEYLDAQPLAGRRIFEYGSGGSTLYWITRGAECVSVEHDVRWYEKLRLRLSGMAKVEYRLASPRREAVVSGACDDPASYLSSDMNYQGYSFRCYVAEIDDFPPCHFDLVLVDGRARPSCISHAMPRLKPGGMLVVDNGDRPNYARALADLQGYSRLSFRGVVPQLVGWGQTDIFIKGPEPAAEEYPHDGPRQRMTTGC
ncbi:hypothetical protein [Streptomyces tailanensis]|uniref:hypothetical protein n=1 Tax=Streptomyces tailanensis TaxID=2569858 RepID=UPI00122E5882|nr:hypothetical protein [Streptomyces tailanensis]